VVREDRSGSEVDFRRSRAISASRQKRTFKPGQLLTLNGRQPRLSGPWPEGRIVAKNAAPINGRQREVMLMRSRLIATLTLVVIVFSDMALAQNAPPVLSVDQRASCSKGFSPLYGEVAKKKWLLQHGSGRSPADTCHLVSGTHQRDLAISFQSENC
jgi:hypothetical protein